MITDQFVTNLEDIPKVGGLKEEDGWVDMQVQFLIDKASNNSEDFLLGWTVLPPGAMHDRHRHFHVDEFWIVVSGQGTMYTHDGGEMPSRKGDVEKTNGDVLSGVGLERDRGRLDMKSIQTKLFIKFTINHVTPQ